MKRPSGTIVARSGTTVIENPSVLWFQPKKPTETLVVDDVPTGTGGSQLATGSENRRYWGCGLRHARSRRLADRRERGRRGQAARRARARPRCIPTRRRPRSRRRRSPRAPSCCRRSAGATSTDPFLLCSTQQCQVYAGAGKEDPRTTKAVEKTRGIVLLRDGGGLVDIRYSASCGGHTEDNDAIWGGEPDPSLRGRVDDPKGERVARHRRRLAFLAQDGKDTWCGRVAKGRGKFRWTETIAADDLTARDRDRVSGDRTREGARAEAARHRRGA